MSCQRWRGRIAALQQYRAGELLTAQCPHRFGRDGELMDTATLFRLDPDDDASGGTGTARASSARPKPRRRPRSLSAFVTTIGSLALTGILIWRRTLPEAGGLTMALESFLPWLGLLSVILLVPAIRSRSILAWASWLVPVILWCILFIPAALPQTAQATTSANSFTVVTQNLRAKQSALSANSSLLMQKAELLALQELPASPLPSNLDEVYPYRARGGSVALLSKFPILESQLLQLEGMSWSRSLHATVQTPGGNISVYVVHAASVRPGEFAGRDAMLADLNQRIAEDPAERILALGDFNAASTDRVLAPLQAQMNGVLASGGGFGFTWPASFPVTRPDHILNKGMSIGKATVLEPIGSDHRGLLNTVGW